MIRIRIDGLQSRNLIAWGIIRETEDLLERVSGCMTVVDQWTISKIKETILESAFNGVRPEAEVECRRPHSLSLAIELPGRIQWITESSPDCIAMAQETLAIAR